ncbi:MAG: hypothetical protein VX955_08265, partial [Pseudomonadota bacterium]|nr:hypothetical protein [Pseudomonadota bacterium]
RVKRQGEVGMRVNVDETGRHDLTLRIEHALGGVSSVLFDGRNPPIPDRHIRRARRRARPVDDRAALIRISSTVPFLRALFMILVQAGLPIVRYKFPDSRLHGNYEGTGDFERKK